MSRTIQLRVILMIVILPLGQIACVSVPEVETRLRGIKLSPDTYIARPGDTLATLAFRYKLDEATLAAMNPHLTGDRLLAGQRVTVHRVASASNDVQTASSAVTQNPIPTVSANQASPDRTTITSAVAQPTQSYAQPKQVYPTPAGEVPIDQIREIPANAVQPLAQRTPIEEVVPDELAAETGYTSLPIATEGQVNGAGNTQTIVAAPRGNATSGWVWPTWGEIAREFAPTEAGGHGIDIAGIPGQEIHAASGGTVAYAGRDLSGGDGKLIIIRHHSGLMSTYSHARQLFVAEDDVVRAGDVIASLGANAQNESVLRFEVRQDGNPLNPMNFLSN